MLGLDLKMSWAKFHESRLIIDGEIDEKHALQIIVSDFTNNNQSTLEET